MPVQAFSKELCPMFTFYTPSHVQLYNNYFLPSFYKAGLSDDFELSTTVFSQECPSANYMSAGWSNTVRHKIDLTLKMIESHWGKVIVYSDVDIQFFHTFVPTDYLGNYDIVFQRNEPKSNYACTGFYIFQANERVRGLFLKARGLVNPSADDQAAINIALGTRGESQKYTGEIAWGILPDSFFLPAFVIGATEWYPHMKFVVPKNIILHHANWTMGVGNKIKQLEYVKKQLS